MEALRKKLYRYIDLYGVLDPRTVALSQELDKHIVSIMKENKNEL